MFYVTLDVISNRQLSRLVPPNSSDKFIHMKFKLNPMES